MQDETPEFEGVEDSQQWHQVAKSSILIKKNQLIFKSFFEQLIFDRGLWPIDKLLYVHLSSFGFPNFLNKLIHVLFQNLDLYV